MNIKTKYIGLLASVFLVSSAYADVVSFTPSGVSTVSQNTDLYWDMQSSDTSTTTLGAIGDFYLSGHGDFHFDGVAAMIRVGATSGGEKLLPGTLIDVSSNWSSTDSYVGTTDYDGTMIPPETAYFGLRFELNGQIHYGWVQIEEGTTDQSVLAWAYETTPDLAIAAGADASVSTLAPVPMLNVWTLVILVSLVALIGLAQFQRKRRNKTA
ncbi:MAG: hypothetical protein WBS20_05340 [Lysobacterales bacterium]